MSRKRSGSAASSQRKNCTRSNASTGLSRSGEARMSAEIRTMQQHANQAVGVAVEEARREMEVNTCDMM